MGMIRRHVSWIDGALVAALVVQVGGFAAWHSLKVQQNTATPLQIPDRGETLDSLRLTGTGGVLHLRSVPDSSTLLIALRSTCRWCTESMPQLKKSLAQVPANIRVVIVTGEPLDSALAYAKAHDIQYPVAALDADARGSMEHRITARTPWAFFVRYDGRIRFSSHVSDLDDLLRVVD